MWSQALCQIYLVPRGNEFICPAVVAINRTATCRVIGSVPRWNIDTTNSTTEIIYNDTVYTSVSIPGGIIASLVTANFTTVQSQLEVTVDQSILPLTAECATDDNVTVMVYYSLLLYGKLKRHEKYSLIVIHVFIC